MVPNLVTPNCEAQTSTAVPEVCLSLGHEGIKKEAIP